MIVLREYTESDLDRLVSLANNQDVSRYLVYTFPYPYTLEDAGYQREGILKNEVQRGGGYFDTHHFARHRGKL